MNRNPDGSSPLPAPTAFATGSPTAADAASLAAMVAGLAEQNARFLAILDAHPERISVVDPATYEVLYVNRCYREHLSRDPVGGICYREFYGREKPCEFCKGSLLAEQPGKPHFWEFRDEETGRDFEITDVLTPWTDGRLVHYQMAVDITERVNYQRHLAAIIDTTVDGYWVSDTEGRLLAVNGALCRMLGYTRDELLTRTIADIWGIDSPTDVTARIRRLMSEGTARFEGRHRRHDGSLVDVAVRATFVNFDGGRIFVFVTDISERVDLQRRLERKIGELARSNSELEQFAYLTSHDLQEPLRKIQSFGDRLVIAMGENLDEKSRDYLDRMLDSTRRMQHLINDLLTYSRVGATAHLLATVDLNEVAQQAVCDLEVRLEQCHGRIDIEPLPSLEADPTQMRMLLQNLLTNALKFHQPDVPPRVEVSGSVQGDTVTIRCADNGIGFEEKYKDRIFRIFQRLHPRHEYEGTGLGLAVCDKIVERHHGRIEVESEPGVGSKFTVKLPRRQPSRGD